MAKAILVLEDGKIFKGNAYGAEGEAVGDLIFNTQVVGFQEILTDPAYKNQIVAFGYPHIGNVGINDQSNESDSAHVSAFVVKEFSKIYSNWQGKESFEAFMKRNKVIGMEGVDTQALTVHIRDNGEMKGIISTEDFSEKSLLEKIKSHSTPNLTSLVQRKGADNKQSEEILIDLGVNNSILKKFPKAAVVSYKVTAEEILGKSPEQVIISSGPGDPTKLTNLVKEVEKLIGHVQLYGIQNGAIVLAMALGCSVSRMKVGHHGVNLPVVDPKSGSGEISVQNHSYGIDKVPDSVKVMHINLNDKTIEKFQTKDGKCVGTLYFPIDERGKLDKGYKLV